MINWKKFAAVVLDPGKKAFVVYVAYLGSKMTIYLAQKAQIALLITEKIIIPVEYSDYANVFSEKSAVELLEHFDINKHFINFKPGK